MKLHLNKVILLFSFLISIFFGCSSHEKQSEFQIKEEIQSQLDKSVKVIETKDFELYINLIPEEFVIFDESGEVISREKQREYTLRDWSIIENL